MWTSASNQRRRRAWLGGAAAIVPSRRTPDEVLAQFGKAGERDPDLWVWRREGDNPYLGVLALADRLVVTGDSVSMVSEALATPHPVEVFAPRLRRRHQGFVGSLERRGLVRLCDGKWSAPAPRPVVDSTGEAAAALRALIARRR